MNWYYSRDNQPAGPVEDAELARLAQTGVIAGETLVWHSGLTNWQPFDTVRHAVQATGDGAAADPAGGATAQGQTRCSQCGRAFPADEVVRVGAYEVCAECKPMLIQKLREGVVGSQPYVGAAIFAGFWIRFGAALLDSVILMPVFLLIYGLVFFLFGSHFTGGANNENVAALMAAQGLQILFGLGLQVVLGLYSAFCVSRYGGTPGKRICELRIVRGNGEPVTFARAFARFCVKAMPRVIPLIGLLYMLADVLCIVFDEHRRALHDQIVDTRVIHKK